MSDTDIATEIADEVVDAFSELHPHIRLNRQEWHDLHEMIEREVLGHYSSDMPMGAGDLLKRDAPH